MGHLALVYLAQVGSDSLSTVNLGKDGRSTALGLCGLLLILKDHGRRWWGWRWGSASSGCGRSRWSGRSAAGEGFTKKRLNLFAICIPGKSGSEIFLYKGRKVIQNTDEGLSPFNLLGIPIIRIKKKNTRQYTVYKQDECTLIIPSNNMKVYFTFPSIP
jgi:hypothetical protein